MTRIALSATCAKVTSDIYLRISFRQGEVNLDGAQIGEASIAMRVHSKTLQMTY